MKKISIILAAIITTALLLTACTTTPSDVETTAPEATASSETTIPEAASEDWYSITPTCTADDGVEIGGYYSISFPEKWKDSITYQALETSGYGYSVVFFDKDSVKDPFGGILFEIQLQPKDVDYTAQASYVALGSVDVYRINEFNVVVTYPTERQYPDERSDAYTEMSAKIPEILESIEWNEECTFSTTPVEVETAK